MLPMPDLITLAQTARDAAGGGVVVSLSPEGADALAWRAVVAGRHGRRAVRLDLVLGTVEVHARRRGLRRRGAPGCTMGACPPRSRRPV